MCDAIAVSGFNSKLVRLKGAEMSAETLFKTLFQFQTGAIKRTVTRENAWKCLVSIPNWCD